MVNERDSQYLLLTPGPLSTTRTVRSAMMQEYSTWDVDYNSIVEFIRMRLVRLAVRDDVNLGAYTSVLMPGSGTFSVESVIGSVVPAAGKLLVLNNGAYGARITTIARMLGIETVELGQAETESTDLGQAEKILAVILRSRMSQWYTVKRQPACSTRRRESARWFDGMAGSSSSTRCLRSAASR